MGLIDGSISGGAKQEDFFTYSFKRKVIILSYYKSQRINNISLRKGITG